MKVRLPILLGVAAGPLLTIALLSQAARTSFEDYSQEVPGTGISFQMVAVPQTNDAVPPFWIGRAEVTWDEYEIFYYGDTLEGLVPERASAVDAISRPTPPYGNAERGFGAGRQPALGMTQLAARRYAEWLSAATGHPYRLPSEKEWEVACESQTVTAPPGGWFRSNSDQRPHPVGTFEPGARLLDMLGNLSEFTATGAGQGLYLTKGGSYRDPPVTCADSRPTAPKECLQTDPQIPKSQWWYSDCFDTGFRLARSHP